MKKLLLLVVVMAIGQLSFGQDEAIFQHYTISPILLNPAAAGFANNYQLQFNARAQWTGFADSPKTVAARYNGPIGRTFGLGLGVLSESAAQLNRTQLHLDYALRFALNEDWKVAFGFFTEFQRMQVDNSITGGQFFQGGDELLEDILNGRGDFDAAIGFFGTFRENTYAGLTFNNLVSSRLQDIAGTSSEESFFSYYSLTVGSKFFTKDEKVSLQPSLLLRQIRNTPFQMDLNLNVGFLDEQLLAGLSYRSLGSLGMLLGAKLKNIGAYYTYDLSFQRFQQYNTGSHELTVLVSLQPKEKRNRGEQQ